jgi:hypothetical protein
MKPPPIAIFRLLLLGLSAIPMAHAAYLESDRDPAATTTSPTIHPPQPHPPTPPPADNPLRSLLRQVEVGEPLRYRTLTLFPLTLRSGTDSNIVSLDGAMARGWLTIQEQDTPSVPTLRTRNNGRSPVFLMAGEILLGGKQNRIIKEDLLLPAESGFVDVPVYCGEQHRWEDGKQTFRAAGNMAGGQVRSMAAKAAPQAEVWQSIDAQISAAKVEAPTRNYQAVYDDAEAKRVATEAVEKLRPVQLRETVGVVVFSRGSVLSCDLFSDPDLLAQIWNKIVQSHAVDELVVRTAKNIKNHPGQGTILFINTLLFSIFRRQTRRPITGEATDKYPRFARSGPGA